MKNTKRNKINLIFSSFLVIGYIICTYFFSMMAEQVSGTLGTLIQVLIMVVFGLLLFYATRVGEGRQVKRFSLAVLLVVVVPSCYIILAGLIDGLPFHDAIASTALIGSMPAILTLACIALGYGIPYTFVSGYEIAEESAEEIEEEIAVIEEQMLEGGLAEELAETQAQEAEETVEEAVQAAEEITEEKED